jgi:hypothetical protein
MSRRRTIWLSLLAVLVLVLVVGLLVFQPWLLFIDDEVDEADDAGQVVGTASDGLSQTAFPTDDPTTQGSDAPARVQLAAADFIDGEHGTTGRAIIYLRDDGSRYLRIEDLDTSNGPDLHVWLTDQKSGGDCGGCVGSWADYDDGAYVELGDLKGNQGSQNYDIPADAKLGDMRSVVIWCDQFNVAFGTADIT